MRKFLLFCVILFCAAIIFAVFRPAENKKTVIKFSSWGSQSETALIIPLIEEFEKQNPDIKIEFIHIPQNYFQKLHLLFASNLAPDVVFLNNYYALKYIKAGLLQDLTPYINKDEYFEKSLAGFMYDGKIYAVPRDVSNLVVYYNKDLFKKYNVNLPSKNWTMQEYITIAEKFVQHGIKGTSFETDTIFLLPYLFSNGGAILSDDGKKILIGEADSLNAIDFYADMANKYHIAPKKSESAGMTMAQMFLQQKLAMCVSGRWLVPKYRKDAEFDWDIAPFPKGSKGSVVNIDSSGYALTKSCANPKEALKFIEFISSKNSLDILAKSGLIVPARKDSAYSQKFLDITQRPKNAVAFIDSIETGKPTPVNLNYQKITDKINKALEPVFLGKEKACSVINDRLLIDISRYAY